MTRLILVAPMAAAIALAGCVTTSGTNSIVAEVQALTAAADAFKVTACAFVPTATTIINIIAKGNPALATASEIATAICAAVAPKPALRRAALAPMVDGVIVEGHFVK